MDALGDLFEPQLVQEIADCPFVSVPAETVLRRADDASILHTPLVVEGSIKITRIDESGKEILMYFINENESCFLSIAASLNQNFSNIDALRAVTEAETKMFLLTDKQILRWNDQYKSWRAFVAALHNSRFVQFFSIIDQLAFKSVDVRLLEKLRELSRHDKEIHLTHQVLADYIGTVREVVSRLLKNLEATGRIKLGRGKIEVINL